jgi:hypothetical protein
MQTLAEAGVRNIDDLAQSNVGRIQALLNRTPAQAQKYIHGAKLFPRFTLTVKETSFRVLEREGVESTIEIAVEARHSKSELKKVYRKSMTGVVYHLAALITTSEADVSRRS